MILRGYSVWGDGSAKDFYLCDPKVAFLDCEFRPALRIHLKTALMFFMICSVVLVAIPIFSRCLAQWSALITVSRNSRMKLQNADKALLSPWANLR